MRDLNNRQQRARLNKTGYLAAALLLLVLGALAAYLVIVPELLPAL